MWGQNWSCNRIQHTVEKSIPSPLPSSQQSRYWQLGQQIQQECASSDHGNYQLSYRGSLSPWLQELG